MGMFDRDYIRRREEGPPGIEAILANKWLWIGLAILIVVGVLISLTASEPAGPLEEGSHRVNVNTASAGELESLPGIGPSLAQLIIQGRPYQDVADLERIVGIGPRQVDQLRPLLAVSGSTQRVGNSSFWERTSARITGQNGVLLVVVASVLLVVGVATYVWLQRRAQTRRVSEAQAVFEEAERRRWEGHKRDKR